MPLIGEVRTGLLQNSQSVSVDVARRILELRADEPVRSFERPIGYAVSPDLRTGVECRINTRSGRKVRGIGTAVTHASVTGCRVLQGSSYAEFASAGSERSRPWSYYLARPGQIELTSARVGWDDIRDGFLDLEPGEALNLGAISEHTMDDVQEDAELDRRPPLRARRTALRWFLAEPNGEEMGAHFAMVSPTLRTLRLTASAGIEPTEVVRFCEDLALHDWLLTTVLDQVERGHRTNDPARRIDSLPLAVEHLVHLWLPGAHVHDALLPLWEGFDRRPGFTRQWDATVNRIRDLVAMSAAGLLRTATDGPPAAKARTGDAPQPVNDSVGMH